MKALPAFAATSVVAVLAVAQPGRQPIPPLDVELPTRVEEEALRNEVLPAEDTPQALDPEALVVSGTVVAVEPSQREVLIDSDGEPLRLRLAEDARTTLEGEPGADLTAVSEGDQVRTSFDASGRVSELYVEPR